MMSFHGHGISGIRKRCYRKIRQDETPLAAYAAGSECLSRSCQAFPTDAAAILNCLVVGVHDRYDTHRGRLDFNE